MHNVQDGSAVELVGLSFACLKWLAVEKENGNYSHQNVIRKFKDETEEEIVWSYSDWAEKIKENFDDRFYISSKNNPDDKNSHLINKVGIYKDTLNSSIPWADYQLRY